MLAVAAWIFAGIALWFSRSVLDVFGAAGRTTRVAMLPSAPELAGLILLSLACGSGVAWLLGQWTASSVERKAIFRDVSLPLFGLTLVVLPYLPWLPDGLAPLRALSGPLGKIVWFVVAGQVTLAVFAARASLRRRPSRLLNAAAIGLTTAAIYVWAALHLEGTLTGVALAGATSTSPDTFHKALGVVVAFAALAAILAWRWVLAFTGSREVATLAWAAIFLGAPVLFAGIGISPDIPAAFLVMFALGWRSRPMSTTPSWGEYLVRGLAISTLPWLSPSYAPMAAALAGVLAVRAAQNRQALLALLVPFLVSFARWFGIHPQRFGNPVAGVFGLLFDQEFGVLIYAPALALGLVGLWQMCVARDVLVRRRGRELALVFSVLIVSVGALAEWWGGSAPPGRPLVPALPLLALPIGWAYLQLPEGSVRRGVSQFLVLTGIAIALSMVAAEHGELIPQDADGSSRLLQWFSMLWPSWQMFPSIVSTGLRHAASLIALWMAAAAAVWWVCRLNAPAGSGASALAATLNLAAAVLVVALIAPAVAQTVPASLTEPEARSRLPMLDNFDSVARPHAIIYKPFTIAHAADIPPLMTLAAKPGLRSGGQPVRVFLNARYALAAGDYEAEIGGLEAREPVNGTVWLQVGRLGLPYREWPVELPPGGTWKGKFSLPVDAEFVGFLTSDSLSSATSLRITPLSIVDESSRESSFHGPSRIVLSAVHFPSGSMFFHDENVYTERTGVWVRGGATAVMTVASDHPDPGVTLRIHSGSIANFVTFETTTWGERVALAPGVPREVHIPAPARPGPFLMRVSVDKGFSPASVTPGSPDRRMLGCWIEIAEE